MTFINTETYGKGTTLVLIHGWAMHAGIWREFSQQLAKQYSVICVDLPGHGLSETVSPYSLEQLGDAIFEAIPDNTFSVLGWSLGASVALNMTYRRPERIKSLILLAGNPRFVQTNKWPGVPLPLLQEFAGNLSTNCPQTLIRFLALQVNSLPDGKRILKQLKLAVQECAPPNEDVLTRGLDLLKNVDLRENLKSLSCPIAIIQGNKDTLVPVEAALKIQEIQPASELNVISGAGHVPFLSHPVETINIIKRFL